MNRIYMILTNGFDPDVRVYKEAKYLKQNGFDIEIICWDRKGDYIEKAEEIIEGIKIKRFYIPSKLGTGMRQLIPYIKFIKNVRKYLKDKSYLYLHCHDFDGIIVGLFTKNNKNKKIIFDMHEIYNDYSYGKSFCFSYIYNRILRKCNYIIYVNETQIKDVPDKIKKKMIYLPNYPDVTLYKPIEKITNGKIRVNYIGSLRDYNALKSLAEVSEINNNIQIGLYGTGICYERLKSEYQNSNVIIYGKYDGINEIGELYRNTDILYCSYNPENKNSKNAYPVKMYEGIVTLTPIVVTENTVAGDFVLKYGIGEVIKYNDTNSITEAILKVKNNYKYYIENLKKISKNFEWDEIVKNVKEIYK